MATDRRYAATRGGSLYFKTPAATTIGSSGLANAVKAAGTTEAVGVSGTDDRDVTIAATNRITATWQGKRQVLVGATVQLSHANGAAAVEIGVAIRKNGVAVPGLNASTEIEIGDDLVSAVSGVLQMDENDYVEVFVYNVDDASNVTVQGGTLSVIS